jgi:hypothetical protein
MSSGRATRPNSLRIRTYQVGFGDCFLLSFRYSTFERHVLIDFGSTARPGWSLSLDKIATQIKEHCGGKLHGVVATHRHQDHISGFATRPKGDGSGDIIASCRPNVIVQPWTENPKLAPNARGPETYRRQRRVRAFTGTLVAMQEFAQAIVHFTSTASFTSPSQKRRLQFLGENNISNRSAVENLIRMGKMGRPVYAYYGSKSGLDSFLPGVAVHVLGPPTLKQTEMIRHQRSMNITEYWHMRAHALHPSGYRVAADAPFPKASTLQAFPTSSRWLVERLQRLQVEEVFEMVRILDDQMNNTSLILLFKVGSVGILFPGDAQFENWSYALSQPHVRQLLKNVQVYKVGHHGSLNGTPKSLWKLFENRSRRSQGARMISLNSTMAGIHGSAINNTEVPRRTLVDALKRETNYLTTQDIKGRQRISLDLVVDF